MKQYKIEKTYQEINEKIKKGEVVVATAEEMVDIVRDNGRVEAAAQVDVVTTGTFATMCSSGAFINFGHSKPGIKASEVRFNNVPAYAGIAAVDCYLGATEPCGEDPLNKVYPGEFNYGGGHVIADLVAGKKVHLKATSYGTACYPGKELDKEITLEELPYAVMCNPRNCYQNYHCAVNSASGATIYTYMGALKPQLGNANYSSAGELSPLFNDPWYRTVGIGTRIFLGGGVGYVTWSGTQHNPSVERAENGTPMAPAGTLFVMGDMKQMKPEWVVGLSILGYGVSLALGIGLPVPILNEDMAGFTGVSDKDIYASIVDFGREDRKRLGVASYADLKSGFIELNERRVQTVSLSSMLKARKIAGVLKDWIEDGKFLVTEPQSLLPTGDVSR